MRLPFFGKEQKLKVNPEVNLLACCGVGGHECVWGTLADEGEE